MAVVITLLESFEQDVSGIPHDVTIIVDIPANVYYTLDGTIPDPTGSSTSTYVLEPDLVDPLRGIVTFPNGREAIDLNVVAIGANPSDWGEFFRRYQAASLNADGFLPGVRRTNASGQGIVVDSSDSELGGEPVGPDGYTYGSATAYYYPLPAGWTEGYGYSDGYYVATSGSYVGVIAPIYNHVDGYGLDGLPIRWTDLSRETEQTLEQLSDREPGTEPVPDLIDHRSPQVRDYQDRNVEIIPIGKRFSSQDYSSQEEKDYLVFTGKLPFDPRARFITMDGRVDGYMNGYPIEHGDVQILNKPYGSLRNDETREDLLTNVRAPLGYISGGLVNIICDYEKQQIAFYYFDNRDLRWVQSINKFTPPTYELTAKRNGVVIGWVFKWIVGRRVMNGGGMGF